MSTATVTQTAIEMDDFELPEPGEFFHYSTTQDGTPNVAVVLTPEQSPSRGVYMMFVDPKNLTEPRLPTDRRFFAWDFDFQHMTPWTGLPLAPEQPQLFAA